MQEVNLPWQLGMVFFQQGQVNGALTFSQLLHVPSDYVFNPYAPGRWASLRQELATAPTLPELWPELCTWLEGRILVAHNIATERALLHHAFPMHRFGPWIDTLKMTRKSYAALQNYKLEHIIEELNLVDAIQELCPNGQPHDALYDACACGALLAHLLQHPDWSQADVERLLTISDKKQATSLF